MRSLLNRRLNPLLGVSAIVLATAAIAVPESQLVERETRTPKVVWRDQDCLRCHDDAATIRKMQWKRGDTNYLAKELAACEDPTIAKRVKRLPTNVGH